MLQLGSKRCRLLGSPSRAQNSQFSRFAFYSPARELSKRQPGKQCAPQAGAAPGYPEQKRLPSVPSPPGTAGLRIENGCLLSLFQRVVQESFFWNVTRDNILCCHEVVRAALCSPAEQDGTTSTYPHQLSRLWASLGKHRSLSVFYPVHVSYEIQAETQRQGAGPQTLAYLVSV